MNCDCAILSQSGARVERMSSASLSEAVHSFCLSKIAVSSGFTTLLRSSVSSSG